MPEGIGIRTGCWLTDLNRIPPTSTLRTSELNVLNDFELCRCYRDSRLSRSASSQTNSTLAPPR